MKQLLYSFADGRLSHVEQPHPIPKSNEILVKSSVSLISSGTERMLVQFGKSSLIDKAKSQPDKVKQVVEKILTDGLFSTFDAVSSKLDQPIPLGYSNVGTVVSVGSNVSSFSPGDRVVSNGPHSEYYTVNQNLCASIPDSVTDEEAVFTVVGSIALQGIRLSEPTFGETYLVIGLGLIGLLTCQLLISSGCRVLAIDPELSKCNLASSFGVHSRQLTPDFDVIAWVHQFSASGIDACIITASTSSDEPITTAAKSCRKKGRIVLVGSTGLHLRRDLFYQKELSFQVSCSYGPGRYDPDYEILARDYPLPFVRWTQKRNFEAILYSLSQKSLAPLDLISHKFPFHEASSAYDKLLEDKSCLGILFQYSQKSPSTLTNTLHLSDSNSTASASALSFVGSGNYASRILIPAFLKSGAEFGTLYSTNSTSSSYLAAKYGFSCVSSESPFPSPSDCTAPVVIATRHDSHASLVLGALKARRHVFVEKPLCLTSSELSEIQSSYSPDHILMVGFNRRFSPLISTLKSLLDSIETPKSFVYLCNAGYMADSHWTQNSLIGGGRLLGESCHFVDLIRYLASSPIQDFQLLSVADNKPCPDTFSLQFGFANGSIGTVHYFANGSKTFPKERLEVFASGKVFRLDNFRKLQAWGLPGFRTRRLFSQDKGQTACCAAFLQAARDGGPSPIPVSELFEVQRFLLEAVNK